MTRSQDVLAADGRLIGRIIRCRHGSRFVQVKRVPRGACVNLGLFHRCKDQATH